MVRGYFGHPSKTLLKVAFGVNFYKYPISVVSFPHKSSIFNDIFLIQYHKIDVFASRLKLSAGLLWPQGRLFFYYSPQRLGNNFSTLGKNSKFWGK